MTAYLYAHAGHDCTQEDKAGRQGCTKVTLYDGNLQLALLQQYHVL